MPIGFLEVSEMDTALPQISDLLGAVEQAEIALECALQEHHAALTHMQRATLEDLPRAGERLQSTMLTVLRLRDRRDRLRSAIARH
jgi:hypothetical protein